MGLTNGSVGRKAAEQVWKQEDNSLCVALLGNPNVGKSTLFNCLTGLHQHTGNWPGKTVTLSCGTYEFAGRTYTLVDLPGTYSLHSKSPEEEVANTFLTQQRPDVVLVVCDATSLERTLILALQAVQMTQRIVLCLNLMDEARRAGISIDCRELSNQLGLPVIPTAAGRGEGMEELKEALQAVALGKHIPSPNFMLPKQAIFSGSEEEKETFLTSLYVEESERLAQACTQKHCKKPKFQDKIDAFLCGKFTGTLVLLLLLFGIFWLTIKGANYPSMLLQRLFHRGGVLLENLLHYLHLPQTVTDLLVDGAYNTTAQVVAVMLPPMAIFFPLFTLLEDLGYLPRVAFLLDRSFETCGTCGKQALTMCMGFGCNAAGVVGCRIIDSPRERKIAMLTNSLVPCNGRFPLLITLISAVFAGQGILDTAMLTALVLLSVLMTFALSWLLHKTAYRGETTSFVMELPPFRRPQVLQILYRSFVDRTICVLGRAVLVAAPAGVIIWLASHILVGGQSLLWHLSHGLDPLAQFLGLNGVILTAFLFAFPANELVLPMVLLILGSNIPLTAGFTIETAVCTMIFCLFHWPCSTTCLTIYKESKSLPFTMLAVLLPTAVGVICCTLLHVIFTVLG